MTNFLSRNLPAALNDPLPLPDFEPMLEAPRLTSIREFRLLRERVAVRGKFLFDGDRKFWVKGVTYGTFAQGDGSHLPGADTVQFDFTRMADAGINAVRVYTVPPSWLLDIAAAHGLRVLVGLPWEQHVAFLNDRERRTHIRHRLRHAIRAISGHPAILAYAVGNEIPASVVRWHGHRAVHNFLRSLAAIVRREDPGSLVTYVNFPTTEYLDLSFVDFHSFNVYLEDRESLTQYLARLQNLAGEKPLVLAEIGLDSARNGVDRQAESLDFQITTAFEGGCAGTFVFAWTDEWHRGGHEVLDWDFGLVNRDREPKPALQTVADRYAHAPLQRSEWPLISVVVCSYNGAATIDQTLSAIAELNYPNKQVIVIDDGSTDATAEIASRHEVELLSTSNRGLSNARNSGMEMARGEIIAYIDDDAFPDPDWLKYLAVAFEDHELSAVGGPNISPPEDGDIAECVANAPGAPMHVLTGNQRAEHIPGCNMAFRAEALRAIGGFDPQFRVAGDDVDVCWRLQAAGGVIGFHASAMVWHHRRPSISRYLKQQRGYAHAERLLSQKWPEKYNAAGHLVWHGRLYGRGLAAVPFLRSRIYHGQWNSALFQSIYEPAGGVVSALPLMPEWHFLVLMTGIFALLGLSWSPLLWLGPVFAGLLALSFYCATRGALTAQFAASRKRRMPQWRMRATVGMLHLLQPLIRLRGRIQHGLGPLNWKMLALRPLPGRREVQYWSESWQPFETRLNFLAKRQRALGIPFTVGGELDAWDFAYRTSIFGEVRAVALVEEHGGGKQLFRLRAKPRLYWGTWLALAGLGSLAVLAALDGAAVAALVLAISTAWLGILAYSGCARDMKHWGVASELFDAESA